MGDVLEEFNSKRLFNFESKLLILLNIHHFLEQRCIYDTEPSFDGAYDVTTISTKNPYGNLQHCWAEFKCPSGFEAKYYFDYFFVDYNSSCANDAVYLITENQSNRWCGYTNSQHRNDRNFKTINFRKSEAFISKDCRFQF